MHPGADESCDDVNRNCDGDDTAGAEDTLVLSPDNDGDGYGEQDSRTLRAACAPLDGWVANDLDCDDDNRGINPDAVDPSDDGVDQDCDGVDGESTPPWSRSCLGGFGAALFPAFALVGFARRSRTARGRRLKFGGPDVTRPPVTAWRSSRA